ncbi:MAG: MBL fold metallo-hydrolase [Hyphomicrobiaceae bacterium]|nr:MBL fold metallo-hydrolase [Hyphomicrobiaceae bacterium]
MSHHLPNRRTTLLAAAAALSAAGAGGTVRAQAPISAARNAGHYRFRVGEIQATVLSDGLLSGPARVYAHDAPDAELREALRRAFLPTETMTLSLNTLLIETGGRRVLIEAGAAQTMGPDGGKLFANLSAIGLRPEDIDVIVISHTHPDHVGNLRSASGGKAFPRATVYAPEADWNFFVRGEPDLSYLPANAEFRRRFGEAIKKSVEPVASDVVLYQAGAEIVPGLVTLPAYGHTPGMAAFLVHSGSDQLLLTADLAYHPLVNVDRPWRLGPDRDADAALQSRRRVFDRAAADRLLVLGFHFPFPGLGRMLKTDGGYAWVPANWQF